MNSLKDKFLLIDRGDYYTIGQIAEINGDYILVRVQAVAGCPDFYNVYHIGELSCECRECVNSFFFDTEAQMQKWIGFDDDPDGKIISISRKKK